MKMRSTEDHRLQFGEEGGRHRTFRIYLKVWLWTAGHCRWHKSILLLKNARYQPAPVQFAWMAKSVARLFRGEGFPTGGKAVQGRDHCYCREQPQAWKAWATQMVASPFWRR